MKLKVILHVVILLLVQIYNLNCNPFDEARKVDFNDYMKQISNLQRTPFLQYPKPAPFELLFKPPLYPNDFILKHLCPAKLDNQRKPLLFGLHQPSFLGPLYNQKDAILTELLTREVYLRYLNPQKQHKMFPNLATLDSKVRNSGTKIYYEKQSVTLVHASYDELIRKIDPAKYRADGKTEPITFYDFNNDKKTIRTVLVKLSEGVPITHIEFGTQNKKLVLIATQYTEYRVTLGIDVNSREIVHYHASTPSFSGAKQRGNQQVFVYNEQDVIQMRRALEDFPYANGFGTVDLNNKARGALRALDLGNFFSRAENLASFQPFQRMLRTVGLNPTALLTRPNTLKNIKFYMFGEWYRILGERKHWDIDIELKPVPVTSPCRLSRSVDFFSNSDDDDLDFDLYPPRSGNTNNSSSGINERRMRKRSAVMKCSYYGPSKQDPLNNNNNKKNGMDVDATDMRKVGGGGGWKRLTTVSTALPMLVSVYQVYNGYNLLVHGIRNKDVGSTVEGAILFTTETGTLLGEIGLTLAEQTKGVQKLFRYLGVFGLGVGTVMGTWDAGKEIYKGTQYLKTDNPFYQQAGKLLIVKGLVSVPFLVIGVAAFLAGGPIGLVITFVSMALQIYINRVLSAEIEEQELLARIHDMMKPMKELYTMSKSQEERAKFLRRDNNTMPYLLPDDHEMLFYEFHNFTAPLVLSIKNFLNEENNTISRVIEPHPTLVPPTPICTIQRCTYRSDDFPSKAWFQLYALFSWTDKNVPPGANCTKVEDNSCYFYGPCQKNPSLRCESRKEEHGLYELLIKCECPVDPSGYGYKKENRVYDQTRITTQRLRKDFEGIHKKLNLTACEVEHYARVLADTSDLFTYKHGYDSDGYLVMKRKNQKDKHNTLANIRNGNDEIILRNMVGCRTQFDITGPGIKKLDGGEGQSEFRLSDALSGKVTGHFHSGGPGAIISNLNASIYRHVNFDFIQKTFTASANSGGRSIREEKDKIDVSFNEKVYAFIGTKNQGIREYMRVSCGALVYGLGGADTYIIERVPSCTIQNASHFIIGDHSMIFAKNDAKGSIDIEANEEVYDATMELPLSKNFTWKVFLKKFPATNIDSESLFESWFVKELEGIGKRYTFSFKRKRRGQGPTAASDDGTRIQFTVTKFDCARDSQMVVYFKNEQPDFVGDHERLISLLIIDNGGVLFPLFVHDLSATDINSSNKKQIKPIVGISDSSSRSTTTTTTTDRTPTQRGALYYTKKHLKVFHYDSKKYDPLSDKYFGLVDFPNLFKITADSYYLVFVGGEKDDIFHVGELGADVVLRLDGKQGWNSVVHDNSFKQTINSSTSNNTITSPGIVSLDWTNEQVSNIQEIRGENLNIRFSVYDNVTSIEVSNSVVNIVFSSRGNASPGPQESSSSGGVNNEGDDDIIVASSDTRIRIGRNVTVNFCSSTLNSTEKSRIQRIDKTIQLQYDGNSNNDDDDGNDNNNQEDVEENITFDNVELLRYTSIVLYSRNISNVHFSQKYVSSTRCVLTRIQGQVAGRTASSSAWSYAINIHTKVDSNNHAHDHYDIPHIIVAFDEKTKIVIYENEGSNKIFASLEGIKNTNAKNADGGRSRRSSNSNDNTNSLPHQQQRVGTVVGVEGVVNIINLSYQLMRDIDKGRVRISGISGFKTLLLIENSKELVNKTIEMSMTKGLLTINEGEERFTNFEFLKEIDAVVGRLEGLERVFTSICNTKELQYIDVVQIVDTNGGATCKEKNTNSSNGNIMSISMLKATDQLYNDESNGSFIYTINDFHPVFRHVQRGASFHHYNFQFNILDSIEFMHVHQKSNTLQITKAAKKTTTLVSATSPSSSDSGQPENINTDKEFSINLPRMSFVDSDHVSDGAMELPIHLTFVYQNLYSGYINVYRKGDLRKFGFQEETIITHLTIGPDYYYYHDYDDDAGNGNAANVNSSSTANVIKTIAGSHINIIEINILDNNNNNKKDSSSSIQQQQDQEEIGIECDLFAQNEVIFKNTVKPIAFLSLYGSEQRQSSLRISEQVDEKPHTSTTTTTTSRFIFKLNCLYKQDDDEEEEDGTSKLTMMIRNISGLNNLIGRVGRQHDDIAYVDYTLGYVTNFATVFLEPPNDEIQSDLQDLSLYPYRYDIDVHLSSPNAQVEFLHTPLSLPKQEQEDHEEGNGNTTATIKGFKIGSSGKPNLIRIHVPTQRNLDAGIPVGSWSDLHVTYFLNFTSREVEKLRYVKEEERLYYTTVNSTTFYIVIQQEYVMNISIVFTDLFKLTIMHRTNQVILSSNYDFDADNFKGHDDDKVMTDTLFLLRYRYEADKMGAVLQTMHNKRFVFVLPRSNGRNGNNNIIAPAPPPPPTNNNAAHTNMIFSAPNGNSAYFGGLPGCIYQITNPLNNTFISTGIEEPPANYNTTTESYWREWVKSVKVVDEGEECQTIDISPVQKSVPSLEDSDVRVVRRGSHILLTTNERHHYYNGVVIDDDDSTTKPGAKLINVTIIFGHFYWIRPYLRLKTTTATYSFEYDEKTNEYNLVKTGLVLNSNNDNHFLYHFRPPTDYGTAAGQQLPFNFYLLTENDNDELLELKFESYLLKVNNSLCITNVQQKQQQQQQPKAERNDTKSGDDDHDDTEKNSIIIGKLSAIFVQDYFDESNAMNDYYHRNTINVWFEKHAGIVLKGREIYYYTQNDPINEHGQQKLTRLSSSNFLKNETLLHAILERVKELILNHNTN